MKRYEQFAEEITHLIKSGVLQTGQKLPSVRHASKVYKISPSTVFKAYYLLEDRGLVFAREKSGYFVRPLLKGTLPVMCSRIRGELFSNY